jgi:hypothetical protein
MLISAQSFPFFCQRKLKQWETLMPDPFASSKRCFSRAKEHIADLDRKILAFFKTQPWACVTEPDPDGIHTLYHVKVMKPIPDDFASVASDGVSNLRSALDHATYTVAKASPLTNIKNTKFPFAENSREFEGRLLKKDFPDDIKPLFSRFKPYKGGNDLLWALNRICNTNKHQMLVPICTYRDSIIISDKRIPYPQPRRDGSKDEMVFTTAGTDTEADYYINVRLIIAFDKIEAVKGQPIIATLNKLVSMVESILVAIEAEARRLGYI